MECDEATQLKGACHTKRWQRRVRTALECLPAACIISTAQQARPKVMGHSEPLRAQLASSSTLDTTNSALFFPFESMDSKLSAAMRKHKQLENKCKQNMGVAINC